MKIPKPRKLPSGKWFVRCMVDGQSYSKTFDTEKEATRWAVGIKTALIEAEKPAGALTVGEAMDKYIESKNAVLSPSTIRGYKQLRENALQDITDVRLDALTQEKVQRSVNFMAKEKSPKYIRNAHGLLSATLAVYRPNFVLHTTLPQKEKKEIAIPSMEEIAILAADAKGTPYELPFLLAVWGGLRVSEIRGLTWDCINGNILHVKQAVVEGEDGDVLKTTKSYSGNRKIRLPDYIVELIRQQPKKDRFIIHYSRCALYNHLRRSCVRLGLPHYRFHDLRHVQASVMLALNVPDKYAMERMGHASNNMLKNVYQHTFSKKSEEVADRIDDYFSQLIK
jgi:integrase